MIKLRKPVTKREVKAVKLYYSEGPNMICL